MDRTDTWRGRWGCTESEVRGAWGQDLELASLRFKVAKPQRFSGLHPAAQKRTESSASVWRPNGDDLRKHMVWNHALLTSAFPICGTSGKWHAFSEPPCPTCKMWWQWYLCYWLHREWEESSRIMNVQALWKHKCSIWTLVAIIDFLFLSYVTVDVKTFHRGWRTEEQVGHRSVLERKSSLFWPISSDVHSGPEPQPLKRSPQTYYYPKQSDFWSDHPWCDCGGWFSDGPRWPHLLVSMPVCSPLVWAGLGDLL